MQARSNEWVQAQKQPFLPPSALELTLFLSDNKSFTASSTDIKSDSIIEQIEDSDLYYRAYATAELNKWVLDGNNNFVENTNVGYISNSKTAEDYSTFIKVDLDLSEPTQEQRVTVTFSTAFGEYPKHFLVRFLDFGGVTVMYEEEVTDNETTSRSIDITTPNVEYDKIEIEIYDWCLPNSMVRIENVYIGNRQVFTDNDIMEFSQEQSSDLLTLELPTSSISFTLDNSNGQFDIDNPQGMYKYLAEKERIRVRYGYYINGIIEWLSGGTYYLDDWAVSDDGMYATFNAIDIIHANMGGYVDISQSGTISQTYKQLMIYCLTQSGIINYEIDSNLSNDTLSQLVDFPTDFNHNYAETLQMCAFLLGAVIRLGRDGSVNIEKLNTALNDYSLDRNIQFSIINSLQKELRQVKMQYADDGFIDSTDNGKGETQIFYKSDNPLITQNVINNATMNSVLNILSNRKIIEGSFRPDIALDVLDNIHIETKYTSDISNFFLTYLRFEYDGGFTATFKGRVLENVNV